jgi:hypothetical protein
LRPGLRFIRPGRRKLQSDPDRFGRNRPVALRSGAMVRSLSRVRKNHRFRPWKGKAAEARMGRDESRCVWIERSQSIHMKVTKRLLVTAAAAVLTSPGLAANVQELLKEGYRRVAADGPFACPVGGDVQESLNRRGERKRARPGSCYFSQLPHRQRSV